MKIEINTISFNVSKTINIGNFEAIKINYGESVTIDPTKSIDKQKQQLIKDCYDVVKKETEIWEGLHKIQHIDNQKNIKIYKTKSNG